MYGLLPDDTSWSTSVARSTSPFVPRCPASVIGCRCGTVGSSPVLGRRTDRYTATRTDLAINTTTTRSVDGATSPRSSVVIKILAKDLVMAIPLAFLSCADEAWYEHLPQAASAGTEGLPGASIALTLTVTVQSP